MIKIKRDLLLLVLIFCLAGGIDVTVFSNVAYAEPITEYGDGQSFDLKNDEEPHDNEADDKSGALLNSPKNDSSATTKLDPEKTSPPSTTTIDSQKTETPLPPPLLLTPYQKTMMIVAVSISC